MTNTPDMNHNTEDPRLRELARQLDALGQAERSRPEGLEDRVLSAVAGTIAPAPIEMPKRPLWRSGGVRMAAGIAILVTVSLTVYTAQRTGPAPADDAAITLAAVEDRVDGIFAIGTLEDGASFDDSVASIELWADALDAEFSNGWQTDAYADDWFGEGAL